MDSSFLKSFLLALFLLTSAFQISAEEMAVASDLAINSRVEGDVLVVGGVLRLGPHAHVTGDAITIFGSIEIKKGAQVEGRILHLEQLASLDPQIESRVHGRLAIFLLSSGIWLFLTTLIGVFFRAPLARSLLQLRALGWRLIILSILTQATLIGAMIAALGLGSVVAVPLTALILSLALTIKAMGMAVLGWLVGTWMLPLKFSGILPPSAKIFPGVLLFNLLRLLPGFGGILWMIVSLLALGAGIFVLGAFGKRGIQKPQHSQSS